MSPAPASAVTNGGFETGDLSGRPTAGAAADPTHTDADDATVS